MRIRSERGFYRRNDLGFVFGIGPAGRFVWGQRFTPAHWLSVGADHLSGFLCGSDRNAAFTGEMIWALFLALGLLVASFGVSDSLRHIGFLLAPIICLGSYADPIGTRLLPAK